MTKFGNFLNWCKMQWYRGAYAAIQHDWRHEHAAAKVTVLEQTIQDAMRFLKNIHLRRWFYRHKLPWFIVLGAENSGKTQLLATSGLELVSIDNQPLQHVNPTAYCDWWFNKEAIFLDGSGALLMPDDPNNDSHVIWSKFVALLNRCRRNRPADGLILCVDFHQFLAKNRMQRQLQIDIFRHRIQSVTKYARPLPVFLLFTKCDQIPGFTDSFNMLSPEDCQQPFGISLPIGVAQQNLAQQLEERLTTFLYRLNSQLIDRLHREHNLEKRARIKDFPLQMESQKSDIITLASQLHSSKANLCGVYFTSSLQDGKLSDALTPLLNTYGLPALPHAEYAPQRKTFFVHQLLKKIITTKIIYQRKLPTFLVWENSWFYGIGAAAFLLLCCVFIPSFLYNRATLNQVQNVLNRYPPSTLMGTTPQEFLPALTALGTAFTQANHGANWLGNLVFQQTRSLKNNVATNYQQALATQFVPYLKQTLEYSLQTTDNNRPQELFDTLKVYLMLGDPARLNRPFIAAWFNKYWQHSFIKHPETIRQLNNHLNFWLNQQNIDFITDPNMVQLARQNLSSLPLAQLVYLTLLDKHTQTFTHITLAPFIIPPIPSVYSARYFTTIYNQEIPQLAQQLATGDNWVLYLKLPSNLAGPLTEQLISNVRHLYAQNYANFWQSQLQNIQIGTFQSLAELRNFTATFNTNAPDAPLLGLINLISTNLQPVAALPEASHVVALQQQLRQLTLNPDQANQLRQTMHALTDYLTALVETHDPGQAVLNATQQRMRDNGNDPIGQLLVIAQTAPAPLNQWLNSLANATWRSMLHSARNHINLIWITKVLPEYNATIKNRYPLTNTASLDIDSHDFTHFFGPNGVMDTFIKHNLAAFIDTNQWYWRWKTVDGANLDIPQSTLEMLDRANLIQKMFFAEQSKSPMLKFSLTPAAINPLPKNVLLSVDGQNIDYLRSLHQINKLAWTSNDSSVASLLVQDGIHKNTVWKEHGTWALFKLFAHANLITTNNSQLYELNFSVDGLSVPFELLASHAINPFIPNMLTAFHCPDKL